MRHRTGARLWRVCLGVLAVVAAGCNTRTPALDQPTTITAPSNLPIPQGPGADIATIEVTPVAGMGGISGQGTLRLDGPAPEGGFSVSLQSQNPAALTVSPSEARIPQGASTASFSFTTREVASDALVAITASTSGRSRSATVEVWSIQPTFFTYRQGQPGFVLQTPTARVVAPSSSFAAICVNNYVTTRIEPARGSGVSARSVEFAAPFGSPLQVGVYEVSGATRGPRMDVTGNGCGEVGRFEVHEASFRANGQVDRLRVTFESGCPRSPGTIVGELRLTGVPRWPIRFDQCFGSR